MRAREPCVYLLSNGRFGAVYTGVTSNLIEQLNPEWNDLAVGLGLPSLD